MPREVWVCVFLHTHVSLNATERRAMTEVDEGESVWCDVNIEWHIWVIFWTGVQLLKTTSHPVYCTWFDNSSSNFGLNEPIVLYTFPAFQTCMIGPMSFYIRIFFFIQIFKHSNWEKLACLFDILFDVSLLSVPVSDDFQPIKESCLNFFAVLMLCNVHILSISA